MSGLSLLVLFCAFGFFPETSLIPSHQKQRFDLIFCDLLKFGIQRVGKGKNLHHQEIESSLSRQGRIFNPYRLVFTKLILVLLPGDAGITVSLETYLSFISCDLVFYAVSSFSRETVLG